MAFKQLTQRIQNIGWRVQDNLSDPATRSEITKTARISVITIIIGAVPDN